jgi:hypothetical protein
MGIFMTGSFWVVNFLEREFFTINKIINILKEDLKIMLARKFRVRDWGFLYRK